MRRTPSASTALAFLFLGLIPAAGLAQPAPASAPADASGPLHLDGALAPQSSADAPPRTDAPPNDTLLPQPRLDQSDSEAPKPATDPLLPAAGAFSPLMNPVVGRAPYRADERVTWYPTEPVAGQPTHLGYVENDLSVAFPIWQSPADEWSGGIGVRSEFFQTAAILPDTHQPFPDELWNIRFSGTYRHLFDNGWIAGGTVSVGTASDQPFHSINEMTAGVNAFLRVPQGEHNAWLFTLAYSPTSELPFPIPGVAYVWCPSDSLRMNIGLPFQLLYRPREDLTFEFSYMLLRTVHARATYRVCRPICLYAGFDWSNESYFLVDRPTENDRLFYYDKRVTGGVQVHFGPHALLDLAAGYTFDRFYFEGQSYSDRNFDRIDVGNGPFAAVRFEVRY